MRKTRCCETESRKFGPGRRQCCACGKTWRPRPKKRGRPGLRTDRRLLQRVFGQRRSLTELAKNRGLSRQALSHRFRKQLARQMAVPHPGNQHVGDTILLADGIWFKFKRRPWVLYLMALRPVEGNLAKFIDPVVLPGQESKTRWEQALATIPADQRAGIRALVVDNFGGCTTIAKRNKWVLQLCNFHLLAQFQARLGRNRPRAVTAHQLRAQAYREVDLALATPDTGLLGSALNRMILLSDSLALPWKYRNMLRESTRRIDDYRAYLVHPELRLPRTTGSAESMNRVVKDLLARIRSLSTPKSLRLWLTNYIRTRPGIVCNPSGLSTN